MTAVIFLLVLALVIEIQGLNPNFSPKSINHQSSSSATNKINFLQILPAIATAAIVVSANPSLASAADKKSFEYQPALAGLDYGKPRTYYPDFVQKVSGLQYKVVKEGMLSTTG
jgi:hypothetical protein